MDWDHMAKNLIIRKALQTDIEGIMRVYKKERLDRSQINQRDYLVDVQKRGFLLGLDSQEIYQRLINEAHLFLVAEADQKIIGYLIADHREKFYDDEYKTWFDLELKEIYYHHPRAMSISHLAVDYDYSRQGVATILFQKLIAVLKDEGFKHLFSIITLAPLTNCPTIVWHTKNGFRRIAMGRPREMLFDLKWYVGVLLYRSMETDL